MGWLGMVLAIMLGDRGCDWRKRVRRGAGTRPLEFREVRERVGVFTDMSVHFMRARRRGLHNHGHRRLCGIAVVGSRHRRLVVPQACLSRAVLLLRRGAGEGIEVQVLRCGMSTRRINAVRGCQRLRYDRLLDS